jgi:ADP-ribosyl-[dinitrogen reductase] hydrolase
MTREVYEKQRDRIAGALFGVAVGDALGGPLEFMNHQDIAQRFGHVDSMIGGGWLGLEPGEITDDTQMTLCVAEGIAEAPDDPIPAIGRRFIRWANSGPKDIGGACASSIYNAQQIADCSIFGRSKGKNPTAEEWEAAAAKTQRNQGHPVEGNGALMRTVYPGLYYDFNAAQARAIRIARMTHAGAKSTEACILYTRMINLLTASESTIQDTRSIRDFITEHSEPCGYWLATTPETVQPAAGGFVVDSMRIALGSVATSTTFAQAVETAANLGGDADTNAAITGGLAGAWYGYSAIPAEWISYLAPDVREDMIRLVNAAISNREG